jgi:L,D-peptidoglycan transpeptidase YkuD (ErfK/YbiS/YcfS/YnhG family)
MRKSVKPTLFVAPFLLLTIAFAILYYKRDVPPVNEIRFARESVSEAKSANAHLYSSKAFKEASLAYDSAMYYWKLENERFFLFRDYSKVKLMANNAVVLAEGSMAHSQKLKGTMKSQADRLIGKTGTKIQGFQLNFDKLPLHKNTRDNFNKGKLLYDEAKLAAEKHDWHTATEKAEKSLRLVGQSYSNALNLVEDYFENYQTWQKWVNSTIEQSRKGGTSCIIVDKFARECMLYQNGKLVEIYEADLGKNWIGDKNHQGDYTTPEGLYKVTDKKQGGRTIYYKALLINYPNEDDKVRFNMNKKNGTIPAKKKIGGLIEIHGHGGQGADWTEGCVALSNSDMDKLYQRVSVGTPVTIVGSLKPLEKLLKQ